jgi:hypothetical protein
MEQKTDGQPQRCMNRGPEKKKNNFFSLILKMFPYRYMAFLKSE